MNPESRRNRWRSLKRMVGRKFHGRNNPTAENSKSSKRSRRSRRSKSTRAPISASRSRSKPLKTTQSFSSVPLPSHGTIRLAKRKKTKAIFKVFLSGFCGVFALILMGGWGNAFALGFALILPGLFLALSPPEKGLGKRADLTAAAFMVSLLFALLPQFYWPDAEWRTTAQEALSIDLPMSLSVQPWISFEAWLLVLAGFAWFYVVLQWQVNLSGRKWLFCWFSLIISGCAATVILVTPISVRDIGIEDTSLFGFFSNRNQYSTVLALGGVATFAYAMECLRSHKLIPLCGMPASILCLVGLFLGGSRAGVLIYFLGVFSCFIFCLRSRSIPRPFKFVFPLVILVLSSAATIDERNVTRMMGFASPDGGIGDVFRLNIYQDTADMVLDAPFTGFGLGSFPAVFPQYRDASSNHQRVVNPESDFLWLAAEGGLLAVALFSFFLLAYFAKCRGLNQGPSGTYRVFALITLSMFLVHAMVDVPGHRPGTVYFAILFAALAIPSEKRELSILKPLYWRSIGGFLVAIGMAWMISGVSGLPLHSSVRLENYEEDIQAHIELGDYAKAKESVDKWLSLSPMNWRAYFQRAQLTLSENGDRADAATDFRRARFVEPILGTASYEEGVTWLYIDAERAMSAWRETLFREVQSMDQTFGLMLNHVRNSPDLLERLGRLSEIDTHYRTKFLCFLSFAAFMEELKEDLATDPSLSRFTIQQRTDIVNNWVRRGDVESAERFLENHGDSLEKPWWLWSLLRKEQADFEDAVKYIRSHVEVPKIPEVEIDDATFARLKREYTVAPKDVYKGTALLYICVERGEYPLAIPAIDGMLESHKPPTFLHYWRAECFYQIGEFIESWYAFESYLKELWEKEK